MSGAVPVHADAATPASADASPGTPRSADAGSTPRHSGTPPTGEDRFLRAFPRRMTIDHAAGVHVHADGRAYVDLGGASQGVALLGHAHPRVTSAIQVQAERVVHIAQPFGNPERAAFLDRLHALLPAGLTRTFLGNSGTEANELALKLAAMATHRSGVVAMTGAFHGRTTGSLAMTHKAGYRTPCAGLLHETSFTPFNDDEALKHAIGPGTAAVVIEPVQGEGGVRPASASFLRTARDLCDDHGALLVFDEVQSGTGRTGDFLACQASGVLPDIVTLGKGLAGGLPIGACSVTDAVADALPARGHGSTYGGSPLVAAAGAAALDELVQGGWMARAAPIGERLRSGIEALGHPLVREVTGRGAMLGITLRKRPAPVLRALEDAGFLAMTAGGNQVRLLPPLVTDDATLDAFLAALASALDAGMGRP